MAKKLLGPRPGRKAAAVKTDMKKIRGSEAQRASEAQNNREVRRNRTGSSQGFERDGVPSRRAEGAQVCATTEPEAKEESEGRSP